MVTGTRQPPLDPLLGGLLQHLLGVGQLRQRLEPALAGIGSLLLVAALLRRQRAGLVGVLTVFVLATQPLFLRYTAYIRPYALPMMLILLAAYAGSRWLDDGRRRWLVLSAVAALLLPLSRVPEPTVFLGSSALVLAWRGWRGSLPRRRAWTLGVVLLASLITVGAVSFLALASDTKKVFDPNLGHALDRVPAGLHEIWTYVLPLLGRELPWWPVTIVFLVLAVALPGARRQLRAQWFWLPVVLAPLVFLVAYHTINPYPLDVRHYRAHFAYFFVTGFVFLVAAVGTALARAAHGRTRRWAGSWLGPLAVGALLVSQLPTTYAVATQDDVPDYGMAGQVLRTDLPPDALVLYDGPAPAGRWRVPFFGKPRYLVGAPHVTSVSALSKGERHLGGDGPVYLLIVDSSCADSVVCDEPEVHWSGRVEGFRVARRFSMFTLYAPTAGQHGTAGAIEALGRLAAAYGGTAARTDVFAQARLLLRAGHRDEAQRTVDRYCAGLKPGRARRCLKKAASSHLPAAAPETKAGAH
nr:glycosyltransferase family 39 protein [Nocardioides panaciterrulae]